MRFSWAGLILAPLLVPVMLSMIGAAMLSSPQEGANPGSADPGLRHILCCYDLSLRALPVSALFVEASDGVHRLPGGTGAGGARVRAIDMASMEKQRSRFWSTDRELLGILRALGSRSADRSVSARRTDNGGAILVASNAEARPRNRLPGIALQRWRNELEAAAFHRQEVLPNGRFDGRPRSQAPAPAAAD